VDRRDDLRLAEDGVDSSAVAIAVCLPALHRDRAALIVNGFVRSWQLVHGTLIRLFQIACVSSMSPEFRSTDGLSRGLT
jgi:hypothetical protein